MKQISLAVLFLSTLNASSQTWLAESFNYGTTADTLCGTGGVTTNWIPHASAGVNPVRYQNTGLSYTGYATATTGSGALLFANGSTARESVNAAFSNISSGDVYVSFLLRAGSGGGSNTLSDYFLHLNDTFGASLNSNLAARLFIQNVMLVPQIKIGLSKGSASSGAVFTSSAYNLGTTVLVVMKYMFKNTSTTDDSVYAWVFTSGVPATEPAPQLIATDMTMPDLPLVRSVAVRQGTIITTSVAIDVLRIGNSWSNTVLPVHWLDFNATATHSDLVLVTWSTASERNNDYFTVERSTDLVTWQIAGKVKGSGNSQSVKKYFFNDAPGKQPTRGSLYYRIRQTDYDGRYNYSSTVQVKQQDDQQTEVHMLPNPSTGQLCFMMRGEGTVKIRDMQGKLLIEAVAGLQPIDISQLVRGMYDVEVHAAGEVVHRRLVRE